MIGVSYNGTLPNAVAATGVRGLETIVPIAAISSWYDYYRANGGVRGARRLPGRGHRRPGQARADPRRTRRCAPASMAALERRPGPGDRRLQPRSGTSATTCATSHKVRASVLARARPQRLERQDQAVRRSGGTRWPRGACRARSGCTRARTPTRSTCRRAEWLHHAAPLVRPLAATASTTASCASRWPTWRRPRTSGDRTAPGRCPAAGPVPLFLGPATARRATGPARSAAGRPASARRQSFVDDTAQTAEQLVDNELAADPNRLAYLTAPLTGDARLSGTPRVTVRAEPRRPLAVPDRAAGRLRHGRPVRRRGHRCPARTASAPGIPEDPGCFNSARPTAPQETPWKIVTRGWLDVRNRYSPRATDADRARPDVHVELGAAAAGPRLRGRPPDRPGAHLHRPRPHAALPRRHDGRGRTGV